MDNKSIKANCDYCDHRAICFIKQQLNDAFNEFPKLPYVNINIECSKYSFKEMQNDKS